MNLSVFLVRYAGNPPQSYDTIVFIFFWQSKMKALGTPLNAGPGPPEGVGGGKLPPVFCIVF